MDTQLKVLKQTRVILDNPKAWTKGIFATDKDNLPCGTYHDEAMSFCLLGALQRAKADCGLDPDNVVYEEDVAIIMLEMAVDDVTEGEITDPVEFNDDSTTSHKDVLVALDRAIELTEENTS